MKNLKTYKMFESVGELTPEQIKWLDKCTEGTWKLNPQTGLVDVEGSFACYRQDLADFKGIRFGAVSKNFDCHNNQLTSLEGAPQRVGWHFTCSSNLLTSMEGAPQEVGGSFNCDRNQLTSLEGSPQKVGGNFSCKENQLTSLEGAPQEVGRDFHCGKNKLTTLVGAPQKVGDDFSCTGNQLTSLEGAPQKVGVDFFCYHNPVTNEILKKIFSHMKREKSYMKAVESLWSKIPLEDQVLLYRPEFEWVSPEERRKLEAVRAYQGFKGMI
jgi:hypothetical protein